MTILATRSWHVGISSISPIDIPALLVNFHSFRRTGETHDQTPASGSPSSYTFLPLAPETSSRSSSNFAPPGRRSKRTTSDETAFLYTLAVFFNVLRCQHLPCGQKEGKGVWTYRNMWTVSCSVDSTIFCLIFWWIGDSTVHMNLVPTCQLMRPSRRDVIPILIPQSSVLLSENWNDVQLRLGITPLLVLYHLRILQKRYMESSVPWPLSLAAYQ
jgi:hypothetical protein